MLQNCHHRHLLSPVVVTSSCSCHLVYVILLLFVSIPCPVILPCLWGLWRTLNLTFDSTVWLGLDRLSLDCWYWVTDKHFEVCETTSQISNQLNVVLLNVVALWWFFHHNYLRIVWKLSVFDQYFENGTRYGHSYNGNITTLCCRFYCLSCVRSPASFLSSSETVGCVAQW